MIYALRNVISALRKKSCAGYLRPVLVLLMLQQGFKGPSSSRATLSMSARAQKGGIYISMVESAASKVGFTVPGQTRGNKERAKGFIDQ